MFLAHRAFVPLLHTLGARLIRSLPKSGIGGAYRFWPGTICLEGRGTTIIRTLHKRADCFITCYRLRTLPIHQPCGLRNADTAMRMTLRQGFDRTLSCNRWAIRIDSYKVLCFRSKAWALSIERFAAKGQSSPGQMIYTLRSLLSVL